MQFRLMLVDHLLEPYQVCIFIHGGNVQIMNLLCLQVSLVINYDLPNNRELYIHRIGRSGRYGRKVGDASPQSMPAKYPMLFACHIRQVLLNRLVLTLLLACRVLPSILSRVMTSGF